METIIKKACKGGYVYYNLDSYKTPEKQADFLLTDYDSPSEYELVCDPLFWQALGKACGWEEEKCQKRHVKSCIRDESCDAPVKEYCNKSVHIHWKEEALRFHEINLTEGWESAIKYLSDLVK